MNDVSKNRMTIYRILSDLSGSNLSHLEEFLICFRILKISKTWWIVKSEAFEG